jgi:hypothetical protein
VLCASAPAAAQRRSLTRAGCACRREGAIAHAVYKRGHRIDGLYVIVTFYRCGNSLLMQVRVPIARLRAAAAVVLLRRAGACLTQDALRRVRRVLQALNPATCEEYAGAFSEPRLRDILAQFPLGTPARAATFRGKRAMPLTIVATDGIVELLLAGAALRERTRGVGGLQASARRRRRRAKRELRCGCARRV